jgi:hypothetical protein
MTTPSSLQEEPEFSLVLGGPLFQLLQRIHLEGPRLELLPRRILFAALITWLPLALLSVIEGNPSGVKLTFLRDVEAHVRFLIAVPVLIAADVVAHQHMRLTVKQFLDRGIIRATEITKFHSAVEAAMRLRNSLALEVGLLTFVYVVWHWVWRSQAALGTASWYGESVGGHLRLTLPGYWFAFVSLPIFQFLLLRWYARLLIWFQFLWRVSKFDLYLLPAHPDRAGGLGFLGVVSHGFAPILFAQGAVLAGLIANRIFYQGRNLLSYKMNVVGFVAVFLVVVLAPLILFTPHLMAAKRRGLGGYGTLAATYVNEFEEKWVSPRNDGNKSHQEELLGTGDIQSLADLGNSFGFVRDMRPVPFSLQDVILLTVATLAPMVPLLLTIMPAEELLSRIFQAVM